MSFTEKDLEAQIAMFEELKDEFSRLQVKAESFKKEQGLTEDDLKVDINALSAEEKNILSYAQQQAQEAGKARSAHHSASTTPSKAGAGSGRKGAIRL